MNFQEFLEAVKNKMRERLDEGYRVEIQQIRKNNDVLLHGLTIYSPESNITPTIYLESFYKVFQKGLTLDEIAEKLELAYRESLPCEKINMDFFRDFNQVKDRIVYRLIHAERNRELLQDIPHIPFWDLAICFSYVFWSEVLGEGMILIHNNHMENWNVTYSELMKLAEKNTQVLFPVNFYGMSEALKQMYVDIDLSSDEEEQMYILTNKQKLHGAAVMLYPQTLQQVAEQLESDFYVIPSSVHELLILKADRQIEMQKEGIVLHDIIAEINQDQLNPEEVLSDYPYFYNWKEKKLIQVL